MSEVYDSGLQARVRMYIEEIGSQVQAALDMGIHKTRFTRWLNSSYENGNIAKIEQDITEFFRVHDERKMQPSVSSPKAIDPEHYVRMSVSEGVYDAINYCQIVRGIVMVMGDSGIGKTMAVKKFVRDNPSTAIHIEASPVYGVLSRFLRQLAKKLNITENMEQGALVEEIKARLLGTNKVVIIDEAQHLKFSTREEIRNWTQTQENGKAGVGIVWIGNPEMEDKMKRGRYSQLYDQQKNRSRSQRYHLKDTTLEDVKKLFPGLSEDGREKEARLMLAICRSWAGIRNATYIWNDALSEGGADYETLLRMAQRADVLVA